MIEISSSGSFKNIEKFLQKSQKIDVRAELNAAGQRGVNALSANTPQRTGAAANSWYYEVKRVGFGWSLTWYNSNIEDGYPVAVMIQHGHGTGTGGYVAGINYINPALRPVFNEIIEQVWKVVTKA